MPSPYKEIPITFEKGLVQEIEESLLDIGQASSLENWEPLANGALRSRNRYSAITTTGLTAPYNVRGFGSIATGTGTAGSVTAPQVVQSNHWPNGDGTPTTTRTATLNGISIGNVLIAVVADDSSLTPTVTAGWTQRAISTGDKQFVKFYTKTAASSTEVFTYTVTAAKIRAMSVYEVKYIQAEDPGTAWAAASQFGGSGTDSVSVTNADENGAFTLVGYLYDGGTPDTADSGTSGWTTPAQDNANTRTGVTFQDLDQLDGVDGDGLNTATTRTYVSPSWTPPSSGVLVLMIGAFDTTVGAVISTISVTGNGFTWHDALDAGELGVVQPAGSSGSQGYAWADCAELTGTTGSITVVVNMTSAYHLLCCSFMLAIGADTTDPFVQKVTLEATTNPTASPSFGAALGINAGLVGIATRRDDDFNTPDDGVPTPTIGSGNWSAMADSFTPPWTAIGANGIAQMNTAYCHSANSPDTIATWNAPAAASYNYIVTNFEIKGAGNAAKVYRGTVTTTGDMTENFAYTAAKRIVAKMVSWGYTPPTTQPDVVDFYIVIAVAVNSTTYKIYRIPRDDIQSGTWELIDTVTDATDSSAFVSFAQGAGDLIWTASTMSYPRAIELSTLSQSNITDMLGLAGRTAAYHKDRMFIAGSAQSPSRVYFSDIGLPTDFTTVTDFLDIGGDDGEAIQDLSSVEGLLLIPKTNRAYLVSGSGIESFFVNELSGGTAATGRSAIRTPYGTLLAGEDDIWVVQGGGVDPMSRPLGAGYEITGKTSSAYAQDSVLICDSGTERVWRVNLVTGAWSIESVTGDDAGVHIVFSLNGRIYYGVDGSSLTVGGTRKLIDARSYDANTGGTNFIGATGRVALLGPSVKYTPRWLFIQSRNNNPTKPNTLFVNIESDHGATQKAITVRDSTQRDRIDIPGEHQGSEWIKLTFSADSSAIAGSIDPERIVLGVDVEAPR